MSSQSVHLATKTGSSRQGFAQLYAFLRDAFQQKGLVSISPEVLQLFKECPLQNIECPDISSFAKLFEGTRSNNRFRLEANSFVYTVQILFHLRPNLVQERVLHLLMVSVRLLKDEHVATERLSILAGRKIDRYAVARKRAAISKRLIPWLLKHFSQDSTSARLKVIAAQFLFHLLQGDEEAKKILGSTSQNVRWSLGRAISASPNLALRVLAANILREISLADIDVRLFWPPDLLDSQDDQMPSSFLADAHWLHNTVQYLRTFDDRRTVSDDSRAKLHEIISLRIGSLAFSDLASKMLATFSERLLFIIPAHQNRPLQILEIPLVANMEYDRSDGSFAADDATGGKSKLRLQLQNTGFYILNGLKNAADQVHLSFAKDDHREKFCQDVANALAKLHIRFAIPNAKVEQSVAGKDEGMPCPKKQSRAVMIDLSQDDIVSGDTQLLSEPLQALRRVSTSQRISLSESDASSQPLTSPLREATDTTTAFLQPEGREERLLQDSRRVHFEKHNHSKVEVDTEPQTLGKATVIHNVKGIPQLKTPAEELIEPSRSDVTSQEARARITGSLLPQSIHKRGTTEARMRSRVAASDLQQLASKALQRSAESLNAAAPSNTDKAAHPEHRGLRSRAAQPKDRTAPPSIPPSRQANSARRMGPKPTSSKQVASTASTSVRNRKEQAKTLNSTGLPRRSHITHAVPAAESTVDWDEDLRSDQNENKDQDSLAKRSKITASHGLKKSAGADKAPRAPGLKKKSQTKDKIKGKKTNTTPAKAGLAGARPRRATKNVSYEEQSEQDEQSQNTIDEMKNAGSHAGTDQIAPEGPPPPMKNDHTHFKTQTLDDQDQIDATDANDEPVSEHVPVLMSFKAAVEVSRSSEAPSATAEPTRSPKRANVEKDLLGANRGSPRGQNHNTVRPDNGSSERKDLPEVEVVEDSHPLDKQQKKTAVGNARKSFGSALMDVMSTNSMRRIETPNADRSGPKPFGNKAAFVESVESALKHSTTTRKLEGQAPKADTTRNVKTPSTSRKEKAPATREAAANETARPTRSSRRTPQEGLVSQVQLEEGLEVTPPPQNTDAAIPTVVTKLSQRPSEPFSRAQQESSPVVQANLIGEGNDEPRGTDNNGNAPDSPLVIEKQKPSTRTSGSAPILPQIDRGANTYIDARKRGPPPEFEKPQQVKRTRKTDPGPHTNQSDDKAIGNSVLPLQPVTNSTASGTETKPRISEPPTQDLGRNMKSGETSQSPGKPKQKSTQENSTQENSTQRLRSEGRPLPSTSKLIQSKTQTPPRQMVGGYLSTLTDENLNRKAQIVGFSAKGPRNQAVSSSAQQGQDLGHSSSVPTETSKHLAFQQLNSEPEVLRHSDEATTKRFRLLRRDAKPKVQFSFSDRESSDEEISADEESPEDDAPAPDTSIFETGKGPPQSSKVDENGSPRYVVRETSRISLASNESSCVENSRDFEASFDHAAVVEGSEIGQVETNGSIDFGLEAAVSKYTATTTQMTAKLKPTRSRPSIGVGKLLDHSFPKASKSIETNVFKAPLLVDPIQEGAAAPKSKDTAQSNYERSSFQISVAQKPFLSAIASGHDEMPLFDVDQLDVSVAAERPSSAGSARVRRLRSISVRSAGAEAQDSLTSPLSFGARLGKMIMPPPPRKESAAVTEPIKECQNGHFRGREHSSTIDAETTLVNGEASEEESGASPPYRQQESSSSPSSEDEEDAPVSASQQAPAQALHNDRRFWNQRVAQTQQNVLEILEQVSQKLLLRFSDAETGIESRLDHYHYGGRKILNNFVEQFDACVSREKDATKPRMTEYRSLLTDVVGRLEQAKASIEARPSLNDLEKSRSKRSEYVLANLEKFAAAQRK